MQTPIALAELSDLFRGVALARPSNWYIGLDTNNSGTIYQEPDYVGYARQPISRASGSWTVGTTSLSNVNAVTFPTVPSDDANGDIANRYFIVNLAAPGTGELVYDFGALTGTPLNPSVIPSIAAGAILLQV